MTVTRNTRLVLPVRAPFRLGLTAWVLRRQPHNAIDCWDGTSWRRVLALPGGAIEVAVRQAGSAAAPRLLVTCSRPLRANERRQVRALLRTTLGLGVDLADFYRRAHGDARLEGLVQAFIGMRPPRYPSLFEALANAVACQQVSLNVGIVLLNRLAERYGLRAGGGFAFPRPRDLAPAQPADLRALGFSLAKARSLLELARRIVGGQLDAGSLERLDPDAVRASLMALPGIGRWSADYVLLRGLGRLEVFPVGDVGARKHLGLWLTARRTLDDAAAARRLRAFAPYAGLVYFHLLLHRLAAGGLLTGAAR
ncbi:MAG: DNA-3-methyladenine glycosylase 2 family protein [Gammaproteobacteria bacterium]|nr:DNA-3-methyladenine glycosylase 2 family protein [Gammaproteobacteria bacterium]